MLACFPSLRRSRGCVGGRRAEPEGGHSRERADRDCRLAVFDGDASRKELALLAEMRSRLEPAAIAEQVLGAPSSAQLLRFLRARKGDVGAALEQYAATQRWRREEDVDRYRRNAQCSPDVCAADSVSRDPQLASGGVEIFPELRLVELVGDEGTWLWFGMTAFFGHDKEGHPIYLQHIGLASARFRGMWNWSRGQSQLIDGYVRGQELQAARMEEASARLGRRITKQVVIMDCEGLNYWPDVRALSCFKEFLAISSQHYPETLAIHFFVNTPRLFLALWRVIRGWMDPVTAAKVQLLGADCGPTLLRYVDADQLPRRYGGTNDLDVFGYQSQHECESLFAACARAAGVGVGIATAQAPAAEAPVHKSSAGTLAAAGVLALLALIAVVAFAAIRLGDTSRGLVEWGSILGSSEASALWKPLAQVV